MKTHYSEADLLETYYMQPGESMPAMMHLASCSDCAARYERLERKLREAAACDTSAAKPETFWTRQRMTIMRRVERQESSLARAARVTRIAAAAAFAFFLGGAVMYKAVEPALAPPVLQPTVARNTPPHGTQPVANEAAPTSEAWQSEELRDFQSVVAWESWVNEGDAKGDQL